MSTSATTVRITVKGVDLELTADEARELASAITDALRPKRTPANEEDSWKRAIEQIEKQRRRCDEAVPFVPPVPLPQWPGYPKPGSFPPGTIICMTQNP